MNRRDSNVKGVRCGFGRQGNAFHQLVGQCVDIFSWIKKRYIFQNFQATFGGIGTFDMALWDIKAKLAGEPLWRLLGGRDRFVAGYASGLDIALTDDELAELYRTYAERGLRVAKLKGGLDVP